MHSKSKEPARRLWYALDLAAQAPARESVEYALMEAGALGTETTDGELLRVSGYFDELPDRERNAECDDRYACRLRDRQQKQPRRLTQTHRDHENRRRDDDQ